MIFSFVKNLIKLCFRGTLIATMEAKQIDYEKIFVRAMWLHL